jgi:hypothetical protein
MCSHVIQYRWVYWTFTCAQGDGRRYSVLRLVIETRHVMMRIPGWSSFSRANSGFLRKSSRISQCDCDAFTRNVLSRDPEVCMYVFIQQLCQSIVEEVVKYIPQIIIMHVVTNNYNIHVFPYTSPTTPTIIQFQHLTTPRRARARPNLVASYPPKPSTTNIVSISPTASYREFTDKLAGCRMGDFCGWRISRSRTDGIKGQGAGDEK